MTNHLSAELPKHLYTCEQTRAIDRAAIAEANMPGILLMKNAARAAFSLLMDRWGNDRKIIVFCGAGNNGGDGYLLAGLAAQRKLPVTVYSLVNPSSLSGDVLKAHYYAISEGTEVLSLENNIVGDLTDTIVVDAMLGTGFHGELKDNICQISEKIRQSNAPVLALDIPTGLNGDTGMAAKGAVKADATMTFVAVKQGLLTAAGPEYCGKLYFDSLAIPDNIYQGVNSSVTRVSSVPAISPRQADAHKGDFGRVLVIGGDVSMGGAALLASEAALRSGAGPVILATRPEHVSAAIARVPEVMAVGISTGFELEEYIAKASVIIVGPGLGKSAWSQQLLYFALKADVPKVIDADALNLIAQKSVFANESDDANEEAWNKSSYEQTGFVMTPHPGEASRLLGCSIPEIAQNRFAAVESIQRKYGGTVVLKGAGSLIANAQSITLTNVGNPGMAVAGMGDVLTGVIAALISQGMPVYEAAVAGVCVHGHAGNNAAQEFGQVGILASDLLPIIRQLINSGVENNDVEPN